MRGFGPCTSSATSTTHSLVPRSPHGLIRPIHYVYLYTNAIQPADNSCHSSKDLHHPWPTVIRPKSMDSVRHHYLQKEPKKQQSKSLLIDESKLFPLQYLREDGRSIYKGSKFTGDSAEGIVAIVFPTPISNPVFLTVKS